MKQSKQTRERHVAVCQEAANAFLPFSRHTHCSHVIPSIPVLFERRKKEYKLPFMNAKLTTFTYKWAWKDQSNDRKNMFRKACDLVSGLECLPVE